MRLGGLAGVHPRVCGGAATFRHHEWFARGPSPRVRGSLIIWSLILPLTGSIPACAGEPLASAGSAAWSRVHPRVCGGA